MEAGNIGASGPKNFGGVVLGLKADHDKATDGPFGQVVSAIAKEKHGPMPPPPVESTTSVPAADSVTIQSTPIQTAKVAVVNSVNESFGSNLTLSSQSDEEPPVSLDSYTEMVTDETDAAVETLPPVEQNETSLAEAAVAEAAQELISLTTSLFDPETDNIDEFYNALPTAIEGGFEDALTYSGSDDGSQILALYDEVQKGIDSFYLAQSGTDSAREWLDLSVPLTQSEEGTEEVADESDTPALAEPPEVSEEQLPSTPQPLQDYTQIQNLLGAASTEGLSLEA